MNRKTLATLLPIAGILGLAIIGFMFSDTFLDWFSISTSTPTLTPTNLVVCTAPACSTDEIYYYRGAFQNECPVCATCTPSFTPSAAPVTPTATATATDTPKLTP